jgi:hypothetical protein
MALYTVTDCPVCRAVRSVVLGVCSVCFAEFDDERDWLREPDERAS